MKVAMRYRVRQYRKTTEQKAVEGILKGLWWLLSLPYWLIVGKKSKGSHAPAYTDFDQDFIKNKWQEIEELMKLGRPSNYSRAVLEADKLLDHILKSFRAPGLTMADRLKASKNRFSAEGYEAVWQAHKIRNELVHNSQYEITDFMAREAIENFQKAIDELIK